MDEYRFSGFVLRLAREEDLELAEAWTAADPAHARAVDPRFWVRTEQRTEDAWPQAWLLSDELGPVFFFKGVIFLKLRVMEIHIQFGPDVARGRLVLALIEGLRWMESMMQGAVDLIRFDSCDARLIRFCEKHLGFINAGGKLSKPMLKAG